MQDRLSGGPAWNIQKSAEILGIDRVTLYTIR
ncbi:MAG: hypothetical protein JRI46_04480 [Deltaproteobacteria bacterium]|nr:hypothetical protein [Deltaproteobacteria bacterium]